MPQLTQDRPGLPGFGSRSAALALPLLVATVYLLFPSRLYFGEGFKWALSSPENSGGIFRFFHPHHLLYNPLGYGVHRLLTVAWPGLSPMTSFRLLDTLFGILGAALFHRLVRRIVRRPAAAWLAAAGFSFSWGWWSHSVNVEVYVPAAFFLLLGLCLCLRLTAGDPSLPGPWALTGAACGLAVLFHQSNVLFLGAPAAAALLHPAGRRAGLRGFGRCFLPVFATLVVLPYLGVILFHLQLRSLREAGIWLFLYGSQLGTYWGSIGEALRLAPLSLGRALFLPSSELTPAAGAPIPWPILRGLKLVCLLLSLLLLAGAAGRWRILWARHRPLLLLCAAFALPYAVFFTFWDPGGYFFWIPLTIPLWILLGLAPGGGRTAAGWERLLRPLLLLLVAGTFLLNLAGGILPASNLERVDDYRLLRFVGGYATTGDLVLLNNPRLERIANFGGPMFYAYALAEAPFRLEYTLPRILDAGEAEVVAREMEAVLRSGGRVYYLDEVLSRRRTDGGLAEDLLSFFESRGLRRSLVSTFPGPGVYASSLLYRLTPVTADPAANPGDRAGNWPSRERGLESSR